MIINDRVWYFYVLKFSSTQGALGYIGFGGGKYLWIFDLNCLGDTNLSQEWYRTLRGSYILSSSAFEEIQMELSFCAIWKNHKQLQDVWRKM